MLSQECLKSAYFNPLFLPNCEAEMLMGNRKLSLFGRRYAEPQAPQEAYGSFLSMTKYANMNNYKASAKASPANNVSKINMHRHIVQFPHPGTEYPQRNKEGNMEWNYGPHHRKFLQVTGDYVDNGKSARNQELMFWGEWEPQSHYREINKAGSPRYLHFPYLNTKLKKEIGWKIRQNTDPFVFADAFYYRCCRQMRASRPTQLASLDRGSVILFGSHVDKGFAIDTVFVVDDSRKYRDVLNPDELNGFVPEKYPEIVSIGYGKYADPNKSPACGGCTPVAPTEPRVFRCYRGATFDTPVHGMYSFVPCRLAEENPQGFERPVVTQKDLDFISDNLSQSYKYKRDVSMDEAYAIWEKVQDLCQRQGFLDGVRFYYKENNHK